ncbi:MAG: TldD/PmbA family protein [Lachnospiraceae bacterium]|nr:TldD/PmbA family protein [Lachnospiraceae bacterium]
MKVKNSEYIAEKKPLLKALLSRLLEKYEYASILACDSKAMRYSVSKRAGSTIAPDGVMTERGFCVKIVDKGEAAEYSFNEIDEDSLNSILTKIDGELLALSKKLPDAVDEFKLDAGVLEGESISFNKSTDYEEDPEELGDEGILSLLQGISDKIAAYDERIIDTRATCQYQKYSKLFLSRNKDLQENIMWTCGAVIAMASKGEEVQMSYKPVSCLGGSEILKDLENNIEPACRTAIELLDSETITPGEYDCICEPDVTGMIVHEAFGHGVEMDMFVKDRALAKEYIGKYVASPLITMHDGAATIPQVASFFFDDEGNIGTDTVIIDKGILVSGICDSQSAAHLGFHATGNGRRESCERKAYTRMTNTIFEAGSSKVEDMIASIDYGFMLCEASSGMEDPKNWGIQCMVTIAREIKDGKLTGKIFSPIVLTGYVPDLLKSISMVSDEIKAGGSGACGKGYKEWVKVSDGGPYIKARIRLG